MSTIPSTNTFDFASTKPGDEVTIDCDGTKLTVARLKRSQLQGAHLSHVAVTSTSPDFSRSVCARTLPSNTRVSKTVRLDEPFKIGRRGTGSGYTTRNVTAVYLNGQKVLG